jgi:light-regulated signal transduction histidine kinase (bacteriophytochrome)
VRQLELFAPRDGGVDYSRLFDAVSEAYEKMDADRFLSEQTLELASEELSERNRELARSNEELQKFAYVVSHDLQEPLRSIAGFASLFLRRHGDEISAEGRELLDGTIAGARRMQAFISDLLEYSRAGSRLASAPVDLKKVFEIVAANLSAAIERDGAELLVPADLPTVIGDRRALVQVFQNLVANALKFQEEESTPRVEIKARSLGERCFVEVVDNGIGIPVSQRKRVFEMFQSVHSRERFEGTGMGLTICAKLIDCMNGAIAIESEVGRGSTFKVELPGQ